MFRITIDNEEVLCDKDITIKEEMLNTPSVILNNVFPKSWEATKDYTTNFYHPDDYSKCIIADEDYIEQSDGTTVDGSNLQINYDDRRNFEYFLKGDTYQYTTTGKNIVNLGNDNQYGINFSVNDITIKNPTNYNYADSWNLKENVSLSGNTYTIYAIANGTTDGTRTISLNIGKTGNSYAYQMQFPTTQTSYTNFKKVSTVTLGANEVFTGCSIFVNGSMTADLKIKLMIVKGSYTEQTIGDYEPYTNGASPNPDYPQNIEVVTGEQDIQVCGKNLLFLPNVSRSLNGLIGSFDKNTITISGTNTKTDSAWVFLSTGYATLPDFKPGETYTLSVEGNTSGAYCQINYYKNGTTTQGGLVSQVTTSSTFTVPNDFTGVASFFVGIYSSTRNINTTFNIQLEKGSTATDFEAYKENTYEINLGKNIAPLVSTSITNNGVTASFSSGTVTLNGTASANSFIVITPAMHLTEGTYTLSTNNANTISGNNAVRLVYTGGTTISGTSCDFTATNNHITFTVSEERQDYYLQLRTNSGTTYSSFVIKPQLEKGQEATTFSIYKTPIELCKIGTYQDYIKRSSGKNLFDKNTITDNVYLNESGELVINAPNYVVSDYIPIKPNTAYYKTSTGTPRAKYYDNNKQPLNTTTYQDISIGSQAGTFTTPDNAYYLRITVYKQSNIDTVMINEGTTSLPYEPYGTGWYICKNIGKVVLNGSESWTRTQVSATNTYAFWSTYSTLGILKPLYAPRSKICNNFIYQHEVWYNSTPNHLAENGSADNNLSLLFNVDTTIATTVQEWNTWLSTHNTTVYYVLNIPTYIGIEDEELISQLESVRLWNGLNNITTSSPYLPAIMNLHYNFNEAYYYMNQLYFSGVVKNSGNISLNPREPHFQTLQILDFKTFLSEGETLDRVIYNKTILETIQEVIGVISGYGFVLGNVQIANPNDVIGAYSTENKTAYDIFNYIAEITQSKWTTRLVDENTVAIDFYDPSALPQGTPIEYNTTYFKDNLIDNMFYSYSANDYRNKQIMTSKEVFANISTKETIISSGYGSNFLLEQPVGQVESITLNNVEMSFATKQDKELGYSADFYYSVGSNSIESDVNIPLGSSIVIQYIPIVSGRQVIANDNEISRISGATGRNGIITRYENRNDASTSTELQMIGQSYIKYKGSPEIKLTVETRSNLWKIGDRVQFNAPIPELATEYMVKSKKIQYIPTIDEIFYTFEMSSSFNSEQDINYFDNQRAKALGNIKEGSYISRNIDIENVANITFQNVSIEKINSTGDNKLNATLNSPIVQ